ncbi:MAG: hypothetical protein J6Y37_15350 [Paludibacteraceae bacterium]|nr:hypothetical protein [Paludibacteraceae bacterium]
MAETKRKAGNLRIDGIAVASNQRRAGAFLTQKKTTPQRTTCTIIVVPLHHN